MACSIRSKNKHFILDRFAAIMLTHKVNDFPKVPFLKMRNRIRCRNKQDIHTKLDKFPSDSQSHDRFINARPMHFSGDNQSVEIFLSDFY